LRNNGYVVFTDLDGSLLNHGDYSFKEALPMISFLKSNDIDIIYNTSKTKKECEILQKKMGINSSFIVENGACVYYEDGTFVKLGKDHREIISFINRYKDNFGILSFSNMSTKELMAHTDFDEKRALLAKHRDFSEPFLLKDKEKLASLKEVAEKEGFKILEGGRFYHCVGKDQDKGEAVKRVLSRYEGYKSIALGDSPNDISMLKVADIAILIPRYDNTFIDLKLSNLIKAKSPGSRGWNESLKRVLVEGA